MFLLICPLPSLVPVPELGTALALPDADFESKYGYAKPAPDGMVVVHCKSGMRAQSGASAFKSAGYSNVQVYRGSWNDWVANGGPIDK